MKTWLHRIMTLLIMLVVGIGGPVALTGCDDDDDVEDAIEDTGEEMEEAGEEAGEELDDAGDEIEDDM